MKKIVAFFCLLFLMCNISYSVTYYSKSAGALNLTATWGTATNGTGTAPANFTTAGNTFIIVNNTAATISANWTVSGAGSVIQVGDGVQTINFTTSGFTVTGTINVFNLGTLTINSGTNPTLGTLSVGSTVAYTQSANQTVIAKAYSNLTLGGTGTKSLANTVSASVSGVLTNNAVIFRLNNLNTLTFTLSGTITGTGTIQGGANSNLSITGTGAVGTLTFNAVARSLYKFTINRLGGGTVNLGSVLTVANAFTHTNGILNLNGQTLTLNGTVTFPVAGSNGSFSGSATSSLSFGAGGASGAYTNSMFMTQSGTANNLNNITINNTSLPTLTLGNALNLVGTLTPTAGTLASAGNLSLIATSSTVTARIGTKGASGNVTGNVRVQSYAKGGKTGWTTMGAAGITGRTFADWNDNFAITCLNCPNGYNVGGTNFGSIQLFSETVGGLITNPARYTEIVNITDAMTIGKGFWVYLGNGTTTTIDILMDVTGPVNKGNFALPLTLTNSGGGTNATDHGFNLLANPYPSPINWTSLRNGNANVGTSIWVYNPDIGGHASYNITGAVSNPAVASGGIGNFIPAGQGFYVQASAATTLTALETYKGASTQALLRTNGNQVSSTSNPMVLRLLADGVSMHFETAMYFHALATTAYETEFDAAYLGVDVGHLGIATSMGGFDYSINGLPELNQNFSIPVKVTTGTTGTYQITAGDIQNLPAGACVILHDNNTGADQDLRTGPYSCTITDTETAARFVLNITINNNLTVVSNINNPSCASSANGSIIANATGSAGPWNYYWKDVNNNIIKTSLNRSGADTLLNINGGNYSVDINTVGTCDNGTQSFTLQGTMLSNSSFWPSASSVMLINDTAAFSFTNTSSNASAYWWDFGDGNGSADTNAVNYYASPGNYTVTLTAYNAICGDTTVSTQVVTILDTASAVGITAYAERTKNMFIQRDADGYYVQFSYKEKTNSVITVQNLLGEKVIADMIQKNISGEKIYIPLGNTENKILILSVASEAGEKTFCKIINY